MAAAPAVAAAFALHGEKSTFPQEKAGLRPSAQGCSTLPGGVRKAMPSCGRAERFETSRPVIETPETGKGSYV